MATTLKIFHGLMHHASYRLIADIARQARAPAPKKTLFIKLALSTQATFGKREITITASSMQGWLGAIIKERSLRKQSSALRSKLQRREKLRLAK